MNEILRLFRSDEDENNETNWKDICNVKIKKNRLLKHKRFKRNKNKK